VVTKKNGVFWDVTPRGSCKNRRFGEMYRVGNKRERGPLNLVRITEELSE
jgi:hypothetical protein